MSSDETFDRTFDGADDRVEHPDRVVDDRMDRVQVSLVEPQSANLKFTMAMTMLNFKSFA